MNRSGAGDPLLRSENEGFYAIMRNFQNERIVLEAMAVGELHKTIELTLQYVKRRVAFGATSCSRARRDHWWRTHA